MKVDLLDTPSQDLRLEIIPLIDVIFCILTFFILAAVGLTRQQAISLDLPSAETGQAIPGQMQSDRLYVSVDGLGQAYLDQQPVTLDLLYDVLLQFNQVNPNGLMVLYAARDARYEDVVAVLDLLRSVGGDRVALATLPTDTRLGPESVTPDDGTSDLFPEGFPQPLPDGFDEQPGADPFAPTSPLFPGEPATPAQPGSPLQPGSPPTQPSQPGTQP